MNKVILLKGLPASGKSTWAREQVRKNDKIKRVCKDDLRTMIDDSNYSKNREKEILKARDRLIGQFLMDEFDVIVDDTNLNSIHQRTIQAIADQFDATVEVKEFNVDVEECIRRDALREKPVGEKVIRRMNEDWLKTLVPVDIVIIPAPPFDKSLPMAILCDIDGTLAHMNGRSPYEWDKVGTDTLDDTIWHIIQSEYARSDNKIILVSGRDEKCRPQTEKWLEENKVYYEELFMRPQGDHRKDVKIKHEIYEREIRGKYNVLFVLDDRDQIVKLWRSLGLKCLQVADGNF